MRFINVAEIADTSWRFIEGRFDDPSITWEYHYGHRRSGLESLIRRPHLGRLRAGYTAARAAPSHAAPVLVSHLPRMTLSTAMANRVVGRIRRHIAFAFNFTDLPTGWRRRSFAQAFRDVSEFVVSSDFERDLYSDHFGLPIERFRFVPWSMDRPSLDDSTSLPVAGDYLCAVGSEARDYRTLAAAMRNLPDRKLVVISRPRALGGIDFPDNVTVLTDLRAEAVWAIARASIGMVVPLRDRTTPNGHVTIVGARLHGIPLAVSRSVGIESYVHEDDAFLFDGGDGEGLTHVLDRMFVEREEAVRKGALSRDRSEVANALRNWVDYFEGANARLAG